MVVRMYDLTDPAAIKSILKRYSFSFSKGLGQNFLIDPSVSPRMAEMCGAGEATGVIEIGPGLGVLTAELAKRAKKVVAIELDKRLMPVLNETLAGHKNIKVINGDVLTVDLEALIKDEFGGERVAVCANLPYYITSPVIMHLLESRLPISSITVMVQKEAAARITARPGIREAGAVSYAVDYYAVPQVLFEVPADSFMPKPKVDSCVIRLDVRPEPPVHTRDDKFMFRLIRMAFNQRRKTLLNALSSGLSEPKEKISSAIERAGIDLMERGERLTLEDFARLTDVF
jgi:16S rRNA (adenine1518-N6/adenine1519-N6)-dimethyltransferase